MRKKGGMSDPWLLYNPLISHPKIWFFAWNVHSWPLNSHFSIYYDTATLMCLIEYIWFRTFGKKLEIGKSANLKGRPNWRVYSFRIKMKIALFILFQIFRCGIVCPTIRPNISQPLKICKKNTAFLTQRIDCTLRTSEPDSQTRGHRHTGDSPSLSPDPNIKIAKMRAS